MKKLIRDPELDQLVEELNRNEAPRPRAVDNLPAPPPSSVPEGSAFETLLAEMAQRGASDMLIVAGMQPVFRISGRLQQLDREALSAEEIRILLAAFTTGRLREKIETDGA